MRIRQLKKRFDLILAERSRIARELHDTLLQGLSGITMQLQALWTKLPASKEKQFLGEVIQDAGKCSQEARQSLWGLRATGPEALEFSDKLAKLSRQAVDGKPISLSLNLQPVSLRAFPEFEYQLLRITQEAISNTLSHANADNLYIEARIDSQKLDLTLTDDGIGFATDGEQPPDHFGLLGMRERAGEIGARLSVDSLPGRGTKVSISLPLSRPVTPPSNVAAALEHQIR